MSNSNITVVKIEFKEESKKFEILRNKYKLKSLQQFKSVSFFDILSRDAAELYKYAKLLKGHGFQFIFHHSGKILAKKDEHSVPILLKSKQNIDDLLQTSLDSC